MSTKTLLSTLIVSSLSMSLMSAATELIKEATNETVGSEQTVLKFTQNSKASQQRILAINDQTSEGFPFTTTAKNNADQKFTPNSKASQQRVLAITHQNSEGFPFIQTSENNADQIVIKNSIIGFLDPWFFQNNNFLKKVSFDESTIGLDPFAGHSFLSGCDAIEVVSLKGTRGVDLATFLEQYASTTLLQRILDRNCKLYIDMEDTGATMANFASDGLVKQDAIRFAIRTSKIIDIIAKEKAGATPEIKPRGWLSTLTFGYLGN